MARSSPLDRLAEHLENLREEGVEWVEVDAGARAALERAVKAAKAPAAPRQAPARPSARPPVRPAAPAAPAKRPAPVAVAPPAGPDRPDAVRVRELSAIAGEVAACTRCGLSRSRNRTVPGQGLPRPDILFVGEGPGAEEDAQGLAFVGAAGQLLTKMIVAMGYTRDNVFIANVVKCRPPGNRVPEPDEMAACLPYLRRQISILKPKAIVALGATAFKGLLNLPQGITAARGHWLEFDGIPLMPTFHPAYLLRNPPAKKFVWDDLQDVLKRLGREPPPRPGA